MDPQACYLRFLRAVAEGDRDEARHAQEDLCTWIRTGGFEPRWSPAERLDFFEYNPRSPKIYAQVLRACDGCGGGNVSDGEILCLRCKARINRA